MRSRSGCSRCSLWRRYSVVVVACLSGLLFAFVRYELNSDYECPQVELWPAGLGNAPELADLTPCPEEERSRALTSEQEEGWAAFRRALDTYKAYHAAQLTSLRQHGGAGVRTLTWACGDGQCTGLGDQLLRLQFFLLMALASDRLLCIHWGESYLLTTHGLRPGQINWDCFDEKAGMCKDVGSNNPRCAETTFYRTSAFRQYWLPEEHSVFGRVLFSSEAHVGVSGSVNIDTRRLAWLEPGTLMRVSMNQLGLNKINIEKDPAWPFVPFSDTWFALSHDLFHFLFNFSEEAVEAAGRMQHLLGLHDKPYIAVHVRTGFRFSFHEIVASYVVKNWKVQSYKEQWVGILKHAVHLADSKLGQQAPIFLATDSNMVKNWVKRTYGTRFQYSPLVSQHSAHISPWCKMDSIKDKGLNSFWVDFLLLSRAHHLVNGLSSFSTSASMLCPIPMHRHSWIVSDHRLQCVAAHTDSNATCVGSYH